MHKSMVLNLGDINIHEILAKLHYGKIIQIFGEFKLFGFHPQITNWPFLKKS